MTEEMALEKIVPTQEASKPAPAGSAPDEAPRILYQAGTLRYTLAGLAGVFLWLLWGDFCFTLFETLMPKFLPLFLKELHASNRLIGIMMGSITGVVNLALLPSISVWSDRYRSRLGRRIPFLLWGGPCTAASLFLLAYSREIGQWLHAGVAPRFAAASTVGVTLAVVCVLVVVYHFFNMVMCNVYMWLLRDVVPQEVITRFLSLFRVVGAAAGFVFSRYFFGSILSHTKILFIGVGLVYLASFLLMVLRVREGDYPPPPPRTGRSGPLASVKTYLRECLSVPLYRNYLLMMVCSILTNCSGPFTIFFFRDTLGLSLDDIGKAQGWLLMLHMIAYVPLGYLCDKVRPMRMAVGAMVGLVTMPVISYAYIRDWNSLMFLGGIGAVFAVAWSLSSLSVTMGLFPQEKYGQFSAAINVLGYGSVIGVNYLAGLFFDYVQNYRMIYFWNLFFHALALVPLLLCYRQWKKHGGPDHYIPPMPTLDPSPRD